MQLTTEELLNIERKGGAWVKVSMGAIVEF